MRGIFVWLMLVATAATAYAAEAVRVQNYDRWKDLPSQALLDKGNAYWQVDKVDSALVCFMILTNRYNEKLSRPEKAICCGATVGAANLYLQSFNDYQSSYRFLIKAEKMARDNHFNRQLAGVYETKSRLLNERMDIESNYQYQPDKLELFKSAYYQAVNSKHFRVACISFLNLVFTAIMHGHVNDIEQELGSFQQMEIPDSIQSDDVRLVCKGALLYKQGKYQQALDVFSDMDNHLRKNISPQLIASDKSHNCLLRYFTLLALNRDADALHELEEAERIESENHYTDAIVSILHLKQEYYSSHGNTALAKEYELKYYKAKDEFINRSKLLSVEQQKFLLEVEELGEEVKDLETQQRIRDLVILGIGLLALIIIGILIFVWRNYQNTKQRNLLLFQKNQELLALEAQEKERKAQLAEAKKYKSSPMDDPAKDELLQRLYDIMENNTQIYDEGFTLDQLASLVGSNPNYVSQVINEKKCCNFNTFVNEYRIKEACRRLTDTEQYGGLTIEAIGQSLGFKSRTNFTAIFKRFTGMTPAAYQRMARSGTIPTPSSK
ncbi:MAG: helix-turn-helix transcriptional regulator [Muribaculaceae bacterium]|nr:helix-turn-helix transcriptional regulator [Muribaculaceae bacterium]